jgi:Xaa-Pro aminopeptidase
MLSLHGRLGRLGVDALLFNTSENLVSVNLLHISGFSGSDSSVLITRNERHLFTDGRYKTQAKEQAKGFRVHVVKRKLDSLAHAIKKAGVKRLGIESSRVSHEFVTALGRRIPGTEIVPLGRKFLEGLRIRKGADERDKLKIAARIASEACRQILKKGMNGRREIEVAADLEDRFRRSGAQGIAFDTIVASGLRSALPHGTASDKTIGAGDLVIIDFGCRYDGYNSDETVTCSVGPPSSEQKNVHKAVHEAHMRALDEAREGMRVRDLDRVARQSIDSAGYGAYFMHGLGHGVGLEIHEPPYLSQKGRGVLKEGMVFTIEPGIYIEGFGGVRLESLVYLDRDGPEVLSTMSKDLIQVH